MGHFLIFRFKFIGYSAEDTKWNAQQLFPMIMENFNELSILKSGMFSP
jgi:hypothetical protein